MRRKLYNILYCTPITNYCTYNSWGCVQWAALLPEKSLPGNIWMNILTGGRDERKKW